MRTRYGGFAVMSGAGLGPTDIPIPYDGTICAVQLTMAYSTSVPSTNAVAAVFLSYGNLSLDVVGLASTAFAYGDNLIGMLTAMDWYGSVTPQTVPFGLTEWITPWMDVLRSEKLVLTAYCQNANQFVRGWATVHQERDANASLSRRGRAPLTT